MRRQDKYGNRKVTINGITFDSKREMNRYCELKLLEKAGEISDLELQKKYELIPAQYIDGKCVEKAVQYKADFVYQVPVHDITEEDGHIIFSDGYETIVEDVKGMRTKDYIIKRKLMLYVHDIRISEV